MIGSIVTGILAAVIMTVAKVGLSRADLPHYPAFMLAGQEGLKSLGINLGIGGAFGLLYGLVVRPVLPSSRLIAAFIYSLVPFTFFAMAWPMYQNQPMESEPWKLLYMETHLFIYSLALVFLGKSAGGSKE